VDGEASRRTEGFGVNIDHAARTIAFRQSWLDTAQSVCPERARLGIVRPEYDTRDSDEALIGTAAHYGIEAFLRSGDSPTTAAHDYAMNQIDPELVNWTKRKSLSEIATLAAGCASEWEKNIWPFVPSGGKCEVTFKVPLFEYEGYQILLSGTADYVLPDRIFDWKTASRPYSVWEKQRWAIQPTAYTTVMNMGMMPGFDAAPWPIKFHYGVIEKPSSKTGKGSAYKSDILTVDRTQAHANWMFARMKTWANMGLKSLDERWPQNTDSGLCSSKWCPWWSLCAGAHISEDLWETPSQSLKRQR
jgi:hypothetical protein